MPTTHAAAPAEPASTAAKQLAHEIRVDCHRALRRLDRLDSEYHDVLITHARELIRRAAALSSEIEHQPA